MRRGRLQLKPIKNKINRQVTFSKRRSGLLKKAHEISVLCDAEVAVIVFSTKGTLYQFSTGSSMEKILERYEQYSYAERALTMTEPETQADWCLAYGKLKAKLEALQRSQRHLIGEELDALNLRELQHLEQQLESSLKHIRTRKNQLLFDSIAELQKKEKSLEEQNEILEKQITEKEKARTLEQQPQWKEQSQQQTSSLSQRSLPVTDTLSTLNIGHFQGRASEEQDILANQVRIGGSLLPWMLRP